LPSESDKRPRGGFAIVTGGNAVGLPSGEVGFNRSFCEVSGGGIAASSSSHYWFRTFWIGRNRGIKTFLPAIL